MRRARIDPKARGIVCAVKRANVIWGKGSADNIRASGASKPASTGRRHDRTHDQTQRRKKTLDQRAPSRHDNARRAISEEICLSREISGRNNSRGLSWSASRWSTEGCRRRSGALFFDIGSIARNIRDPSVSQKKTTAPIATAAAAPLKVNSDLIMVTCH